MHRSLYTKPRIYERLETEGIRYAIRLPANRVLQECIAHLLTRPVGRPPNKPQVFFASFSFRAQSWSKPRRVVAKVEWHRGELYPRVGFIVTGLIGNAKWAGTPLAPLLQEAGVKDGGIEVVFWGTDVAGVEMHQNFARSMSLEDAMNPENLLCYEMNGAELPAANGYPRGPSGYLIIGATWGAPVAGVEVRIDDGPWQAATIDTADEAEFAWKIWSLDWPDPAPGEHTVTSRAIVTSMPDGCSWPVSDRRQTRWIPGTP